MTAPHYVDDAVTLYAGACLDVLRSDLLGYDHRLGYAPPAFPDNSIDAVITDPPYGIGFMGHQWDQPGEFGPLKKNGRPSVHRRRPDGNPELISQGAMEAGRYDLSAAANQRFQAWCEEWATECLRVLKPGGHFLSFGGSRTWHRLAAAVEDAGFEIRDSIAWLYGSGFPKSLDVSKAIDRAAGAEREVVGNKLDRPGYHLNGHDGGEAFGHGLSSSTPETRLASALITAPATDDARTWQGWGTALKPAFEPIVVGNKPLAGTVAANVLEHGTSALNVDACRITVPDDDYARNQSGDRGHGGTRDLEQRGSTDLRPGGGSSSGAGRWPTNVVLDESQAAELDRQAPATGGSGKASGPGVVFGARNGYDGDPAFYGDTGGASRFFPTFRYEAKAPTHERPRDGETAHPTVKPLDLMRWLVRLVTPPGGTVLDPFAGSGTTAEACVIEGMRCITIEREPDYLPLIVQRLSKPIALDLFGGDTA